MPTETINQKELRRELFAFQKQANHLSAQLLNLPAKPDDKTISEFRTYLALIAPKAGYVATLMDE